MSARMDVLIEKLLENMRSMHYIVPDDIPGIELYMDQVTTFMDKHMASLKRSEEDRILTKTMINNYAKNNLLPPPIKKKYSKNHILLMIFIYYLKGFLSISDIQSLLTPLAQNHFDENSSLPLTDIYEQVLHTEKEQLDLLLKDIENKYQIAKDCFKDEPDEGFLQCFSMICMLSFDVYMKKQMIERMIDTLLTKPDADKKADTKEKTKTDAKTKAKADTKNKAKAKTKAPKE